MEDEKKGWEYTPEGIDYDLDTARDLVSDGGRYWLTEIMALLPENVIDFIVENIVFISGNSDGNYYSFDHIFFRDKKGFILFSDNLWKKNKTEIAFTIAHEIAHVWRGDSELKDVEELRVKRKGPPKREIEADKLTIKWLSKHFPKEKLLKCCSYFKPSVSKKR